MASSAQIGTESGDIATARSLVEACKRFVDDHLLGRAEVIDAVEDEAVLE